MTIEPVHRTALLLVVIASLCSCVVLLLCEQGDGTVKSIAWKNRINPNRASVGSLSRLTGIGPVRARAIVAFREAFKAKHAHGLAFKTVQDLQKVKGIGPATIESNRAWLELAPADSER